VEGSREGQKTVMGAEGKCFLNCSGGNRGCGGGYSRDDRGMVVKVLHNYATL